MEYGAPRSSNVLVLGQMCPRSQAGSLLWRRDIYTICPGASEVTLGPRLLINRD